MFADYKLGNVTWYDVSTAVQKSKESKKDLPVMIYVYSTTCPYCKIFFNRVDKSKEFQKTLNEYVIPVMMTQEQVMEVGIGRVDSVPSFLFFDKNLQECFKPVYGLPKDFNYFSDYIRVSCKPELLKKYKRSVSNRK
jgi:thioredoxin-related protein